jgi:hypothetical protein
LYEAKWYEPLVVFPKQSWGPAVVYRYMTAVIAAPRRGASNTAVQDANPQVVEIGQEIEMQVEVQNIPMGSKYRPFKVYPIAAFEDDDGNRFGWTLDRTGGKPDDEISGRWEFVDENYPLASTGVLRELLDQAQSWPPDSAT